MTYCQHTLTYAQAVVLHMNHSVCSLVNIVLTSARAPCNASLLPHLALLAFQKHALVLLFWRSGDVLPLALIGKDNTDGEELASWTVGYCVLSTAID